MVMLTAVSADAQSKGTKRSGTKAQTTQHKGGGNRSGKKKGKQTYTNAQIRGLESERSQVQKDIKDQQNKLRANKADVEERLKNLLSINGEITAKQKDIDDYESEIQNLNGDIRMLQSQLGNLQQQLDERKEKYVQSMRYMAKHRAIQDRLMFIFSAKSLAQAYRRMRFVREYASYERAQGEQIKIKQGELNHKNSQLENVKGNKSQLLSKGKAAQQELRQKQEEQQQIMDGKIEEYRYSGYSDDEAVKLAEEWVALPGTSEHQLGIAVDINADNSGSSDDEVYNWLYDNAWKYGFIKRYPEDKTDITGVINEPWHYRYVGEKAAKEIWESGQCLEEYLGQ